MGGDERRRDTERGAETEGRQRQREGERRGDLS